MASDLTEDQWKQVHTMLADERSKLEAERDSLELAVADCHDVLKSMKAERDALKANLDATELRFHAAAASNRQLRELAGELLAYLVHGTPNDITPILAKAREFGVGAK